MSRYVVVDLEMCRVPKSKRCVLDMRSELIQIGAVELDENLEICRSFMTYVKPQVGVIDSFIHRLTGISNRDVADAPNSGDALKLFLDWLPEDAVMVAWSENDARQIDDEMYFKNIDLPELYDYIDGYIDCQEVFSEKLNRERRYNLTEALTLAGVEYEEHVHDALTDARNTAVLFSKTQKEDKLILSPYFWTQEDALAYVYSTFTNRCRAI